MSQISSVEGTFAEQVQKHISEVRSRDMNMTLIAATYENGYAILMDYLTLKQKTIRFTPCRTVRKIQDKETGKVLIYEGVYPDGSRVMIDRAGKVSTA